MLEKLLENYYKEKFESGLSNAVHHFIDNGIYKSYTLIKLQVIAIFVHITHLVSALDLSTVCLSV